MANDEWTMHVENAEGQQISEDPPRKMKKPVIGDKKNINNGGIPEGQLRDGDYIVIEVNEDWHSFVVAPDPDGKLKSRFG